MEQEYNLSALEWKSRRQRLWLVRKHFLSQVFTDGFRDSLSLDMFKHRLADDITEAQQPMSGWTWWHLISHPTLRLYGPFNYHFLSSPHCSPLPHSANNVSVLDLCLMLQEVLVFYAFLCGLIFPLQILTHVYEDSFIHLPHLLYVRRWKNSLHIPSRWRAYIIGYSTDLAIWVLILPPGDSAAG